MNRATYACPSCGFEKTVEERPWVDGPREIRTGCPECMTLRRFRWRSDPEYIVALAR